MNLSQSELRQLNDAAVNLLNESFTKWEQPMDDDPKGMYQCLRREAYQRIFTVNRLLDVYSREELVVELGQDLATAKDRYRRELRGGKEKHIAAAHFQALLIRDIIAFLGKKN